MDVGFVHQQDGIARQIGHQPIDVALGGKRGGGVIRIAKIDEAAAGSIGFGGERVNIRGVVGAQFDQVHGAAERARGFDGAFVRGRHADQRARSRGEQRPRRYAALRSSRSR